MSSNFTFEHTPIDGLYVITPKRYTDSRGFFLETYHERTFYQNGIHVEFVQDNRSVSHRGVLRGLHFQKKQPQAKLVCAVSGQVFDVAVDLRKDSPTYSRWFGIVLDDQESKMMYIPEGFAHGYLALSEIAVFSYKCSSFFNPKDEGGIRWDDPTIRIDWPLPECAPVLSHKDSILPFFERAL